MKKHLFLFILTLAVLSVSNVWAADTVLDFTWTYTVGDNMPADGNFSFSGKVGDAIKSWSDNWVGFNGNVTATSRNTYSLKSGTYTFTLRLQWQNENRDNCKVPKIQLNSETEVTHADVNLTNGVAQDVEYSVRVPSNDNYTIKVISQDGDRDKFGIRSLTIPEEAIGGESSCPSAYSFTYKNGSSAWSDPVCFTNTGTSDGNDGYYWTAECTLPTDGVSFKLGWEGTDNAANAKTVEVDFSYMPYDLQRTKTFGVHPTSSNTGGAEGYLRVRSSYNDNNKYIGFIPAGYVLRTGSGESWSSINFVPASEDYDETDWSTPLTTLSSSTAAKHYYVGLKTSSGYVWSNAYSEDWSRLIFLQTKGSSTSGWRADNAKMQLHYWKNEGGVDAYITMTDDDGDGVYEAWLPNVSYDRIQFKRLNSTMSTTWNETGNLELQSDKNMYIIEEDFSQTGWGVYDQAGKFHIYANSSDKNWYLRFKPHFVLTYDANGGSGAPDEQSVAIDAVSKSVTVAAGSGMTAPTGHEFAGWNPDKDDADAGTIDGSYDPTDNVTLSADMTLYAVWSPLSYDVTLNTNDGTINAGDVTSYTYGTGATLPTNVTKTGYNFGGWYDNSGLTGDAVTSISSSETGDKEYWAKWTAKTTAITIDVNTTYHGSTGSSVTATWGQALSAFSPAVGAAGYGLEGYYTGANDGTKIINADGTLVASTTYTTADSKWNSELGELTLYPHYEEMTTYAVTVNRNNSSYGTVTGASSYAEGATVNISATPAGGYEFVNWTTSDGVSFANANSASTSFTMIASDVTVQANFRAETCESGYTLECENALAVDAVTTTGRNRPTENNAGVYDNYYANYSGSGYFDMKGQNGEIYLPVHLNGGTYSFTIYRINGGNRELRIYSKTYTSYQSLTYSGSTYYRISSNGYDIDGNDEWQGGWKGAQFINYTYQLSNVSLSAGDYVIGLKSDQWCAWDKVDITNNSTYTVTYNVSGAATGSTISAVDDEDNSVSSGSSVSACTEVTFTATPASGYVVEHWQVGGVTYADFDGLDEFTLAISRNVTVTYTTVEASAFAVTVNTNNALYGSASAGKAEYESGETVTLTATPNEGYGFVNWTTSDGVTFADANSASTTFTMPSKNVTVTANFAPLRTIHFEVVGGNGTVSAKVKATSAVVSDGDQIASGTTLTFTATPSSGYSVLGWYTYASSTETYQDDTRATNTFDYELTSDMTIRVKFTKIRIATGDANVGSHDEYADNNASMSVSNVVDPASKFDHKVLEITYTMNSADNEASYYGMSLPVDAGYTTSIASGKAGMGFWYRTASTNDQVLMYFCIGGTDGSHQFESLLPATNQKWQYWYIATDYVDDNTTFGFYINGTKNGKSSGVIGSEATVWLSEVEPLTPADVTVSGNETKEIAPVVEDLVIYQGGEVTNSEDVIVTGSIAYHRHAKGGALTNKLDQWYTFAVPFTVSGIEVKESSTWYAINAVHYTTNGDQSSEPDGPGHFYLQYLKNDTKNQMTNDRWMYINPAHSEYIDADTEDWDGYRYGYPKKDSAYIILFDSTDPIGNYFETNTEIRFVGGPQTIAATAWTPDYDVEETEYWMYANNTLHSITLTNDAYVLNESGTMFVLEEEPTIRPFECYIQATEEFKLTYASIPMRRPGGNTPTAIEDIELNDTSRTIKVLHQGHLIIIRNGQGYNLMGARVR